MNKPWSAVKMRIFKSMQISWSYDAPNESFNYGHKAFYRYSEKNLFMNKLSHIARETQQLKESLLTHSRFIDMPQLLGLQHKPTAAVENKKPE